MLKTWMAMIQLQQGALHCPQVRSDLILFDFFGSHPIRRRLACFVLTEMEME
jgi:hypothetical protein